MVTPEREQLLSLLQEQPRGRAQRHDHIVRQAFAALEASRPADLGMDGAPELLEGVWELRWSSSRQPYLQAAPWLENLQVLAPSQGRAMNLLRVAGPLGPLVGIALEAEIRITTAQRVEVRFQRGGWLGPRLAGGRLQLLRRVTPSFPAWLDITVLDRELRLCRGNAGTLFALLRRDDLQLADLLPPLPA
ncbi:PAP/fibrillin family protein [Cyanobium sp. NIES-981]|uniref:PAP/fibrillin family protein n=1 Tax=Cyanobium sp. NIES-981 TaxID=1851505 RepID=UPI0007DDE716|nr:PAP/fibrillin family protein [Cyanobium sp. NIES-981]SBO42065.1 conserved protein of unknown function [Cyanobium sp. NIES-981]